MRHNDGLQCDEGGCSSLWPRSPICGLSNYPGCLATSPKASPPGPAGQQLGTPSIVCCPAFWTPRPHQGWAQPLQGPAWYQWMGGAGCLKKQFRCLKPTCSHAAGKAAQLSDRKPLCQRGVVLRLVALAVLSWVRWRREGEPDLVLGFSENHILFLSWTSFSILTPCSSNGSGGCSQPRLPVLLQLPSGNSQSLVGIWSESWRRKWEEERGKDGMKILKTMHTSCTLVTWESQGRGMHGAFGVRRLQVSCSSLLLTSSMTVSKVLGKPDLPYP